MKSSNYRGSNYRGSNYGGYLQRGPKKMVRIVESSNYRGSNYRGSNYVGYLLERTEENGSNCGKFEL